METEKELELEMKQILFIKHWGCGSIRCRKCVLNKVCTHHPKDSKDIALAVELRIRKGK